MTTSATLCAGLFLAVNTTVGGVSAQSEGDLFEARVRPLLATQCAECHCAEDDSGGLSVSTLEELLEGGDSGPAILPGDPDGSLLVRVMRHEVEDFEMPLGEPALEPREIAGIVDWIRAGAQWPATSPRIVFDEDAEPTLSPSATIFLAKVRPVFEQTCFSCHAADARGGLRLDTREHMLAGGGRGVAVVPGHPERSLLITALRHERDDLRMPRDRPKLADETIEAFASWIRSGAEWADPERPVAIARREVTPEERAFWSFQALADTAPPPASGSGWGRTEIDRFLASAQERAGVRPVRAADRRSLIRRATFDLTGLPPSPQEVKSFLQDDSPDAFAKVVDRLLASKHYGERWARHWLDVTRFGEDDTRGLAEDGSGRERYKMAYVHRDWVVRAFNDDMPYSTFVQAQLAADQMPEDVRKDLLPGLGFLGQGPWYYDVADPPVARADERHDRVDVTSRAFLGLSVGCARCHDHKYDPIGMHDYYSMAGVFNNTNYHEYPIAAPEVAARFEADRKFIKQLEKGLKEFLNTESKQLARVLTSQAARYMKAAWKVAGKEQLPVEQAAGKARLDLEVLERWVDFLDDDPKHYPFLKDWQALVADENATEKRVEELAESFQRLLLEVVAEQAKLKERNRKIIAKGMPLEEIKSVPMPNGFESFFDQHQLELDTMDRERLSLFSDVFDEDLDNEIDTFFPKPALLWFEKWGLERQLSRAASDHVAALRAEIERRKKALPDIPVVMGVRDKEDGDLVDLALHLRGNPSQLGEPVPRSFLHVLAADEPVPYAEGSGRLRLAAQIAAHPLTARVFVNRVWGWHMGRGLVETPSNFGFAGAPPSHPELLEFLSARFVAGGMRLKQLHRDIMLSAAYQLAVDDDEANRQVDPGNRFLWRFQRRRMDAEEIRDAQLSVSGELDRKLGGPSLDLGEAKNRRRTLYGEVSRFLPHEYLRTFDFPNPSLSAERRFSTNTPVQALYFMNAPFVQARAEAFVRRLASGSGPQAEVVVAAKAETNKAQGQEPDLPAAFDDRAMIDRAYALLYARAPRAEEVALGLALLAEQRAAWQAAHEAAGGEPETGAAGPGATGTARTAREASMSAWSHYARALFSTVEFRFID